MYVAEIAKIHENGQPVTLRSMVLHSQGIQRTDPFAKSAQGEGCFQADSVLTAWARFLTLPSKKRALIFFLLRFRISNKANACLLLRKPGCLPLDVLGVAEPSYPAQKDRIPDMAVLNGKKGAENESCTGRHDHGHCIEY
jgi:hypothetical protein